MGDGVGVAGEVREERGDGGGGGEGGAEGAGGGEEVGSCVVHFFLFCWAFIEIEICRLVVGWLW